MNKINILPANVSNKIAAGEVVERPASVVKELMENAIDSGASSIVLEIKNGGISYIRVTDNGCGMSPQDAKIAFDRHATSKIKTEDDLENISSLGFRGEALSSIAAVSRIEILTKTAEGSGVSVKVEDGSAVDCRAAGCPDGTTIIVRDLFYNTPARMKFLKTDRTEVGYISDIVEHLALSHADVAVKYIADGRVRLQTGGDGNAVSVIYNVYGAEYAKGAINVSHETKGISVSGIVGTPQTARANRAFQSVFINGRYVKSRVINSAVEEAYKNRLMTGKYPFFVLYINMPFDSLDVNVHPSKMEVKFADERSVYDAVYWAVVGAHSNGNIVDSKERIEDNTKYTEDNMHLAENTKYSVDRSAEELRSVKFSAPPTFVKSVQDTGALRQTMLTEQPVEVIIEEARQEDEYCIIGSLFGTYILAQRGETFILIDQHAAHERQIYEQLRLRGSEGSQMMLSPVTLVLTKAELSLVMENVEILSKLGFEAEQFGENSIIVRAVPTPLTVDEIKSLILDIIGQIEVNKHDIKIMERALYTIACKAAVKANRNLSHVEMRPLIDFVFEQNGIDTCPHGRPLMHSFSKHEVEKMFKRA